MGLIEDIAPGPVALDTAIFRAGFRVATPDALQLAAAVVTDCVAYLTNDRTLPNVRGLRTLQLRDYLPRA